MMTLLDVLSVIVSTAVIIVYLLVATYDPEDLEFKDSLMLSWALFNILKVVIACW